MARKAYHDHQLKSVQGNMQRVQSLRGFGKQLFHVQVDTTNHKMLGCKTTSKLVVEPQKPQLWVATSLDTWNHGELKWNSSMRPWCSLPCYKIQHVQNISVELTYRRNSWSTSLLVKIWLFTKKLLKVLGIAFVTNIKPTQYKQYSLSSCQITSSISLLQVQAKPGFRRRLLQKWCLLFHYVSPWWQRWMLVVWQ